ncbi:CPBP family intramembrane glutamic endopeptidase [Clostridium novyi]|uniref:CPBP family intramembrane glutamic endopeptidase n=1 Tax=Clostridium novyi TaxID=1542 RepID=UPI0004D624E0|nr:type II CAAX endopeptidase family protein [Clostridium novyi]KEH93816.1 CAAX protease [Clostridium novyi A str. GD211209]
MDKYFEKITIPVLLGVYILVGVVAFIASQISGKISGCAQNIFNDNFFSIISQLLLIGFIVYKLKKSGFNFKDSIRDFKSKPKYKDGLIIIVIHGILAIAAAIGIAYIVYKINPGLSEKMMGQKILENSGTIYDAIYEFILVVILAPIIEELVFRGIILNRLKMRWGIGSAIIVSSILFGVLHINLAVIGAFLFGVMMCIVYMKTRNIFVTMLIHCINNFLCSLPSIHGGGTDEFSKTDINDLLLLGKPAIAIFCVTSIIAIWYIVRNWPKKRENVSLN